MNPVQVRDGVMTKPFTSIVFTSLILGSVLFGVISLPSPALASPISPSSISQAPKMKFLVNRAFQLAGKRDSSLIQCRLSPNGQAFALKAVSKDYFKTTGQNMENFDEEYAKGFKEGLTEFKNKNKTQRELLCAKLS